MSAVRSRVLTAGAVALAMVGFSLAQGTFAAGTPANKVAASGSTVERLDAANDTVLLSETVKINNPTDLIIAVSAECSIYTEIASAANGATETAFGRITLRVTIDGQPVPVNDTGGDANGGDQDGGRVVFCDRLHSQKWTDGADGDDGDDEFRQYQNTKAANAFNWVALNVGTNYVPADGSNVHKIEVLGEWEVSAETANSVAHAAVGNRTLVLEPVKAAVGETVTELN